MVPYHMCNVYAIWILHKVAVTLHYNNKRKEKDFMLCCT